MYRAQHSTAQHSTAQHSTAQHSTAQHSTAQPYLVFYNYCCNNHSNPKLDCTSFDFFREKGIGSREQGIVLAKDSPCHNRHYETASHSSLRADVIGVVTWQSTKILPLLRGDVSHRLTERFSEQSEIDFQHHSDFYVQNKPFPSRLRSENSIAFYGGAIC